MPDFNLKVSRNIGGQTYEVSMVLKVDPMDEASKVLADIDSANKQLVFIMSRYAASIVPGQKSTLPAAQHLPNSNPGTPGDTETVPAVWLNVSMDKGKTYYKVTTEKVKQYGIPVWPEVLEKAGFVVSEIPAAGIDLSDYDITCSKVAGKLTKVLMLDMRF